MRKPVRTQQSSNSPIRVLLAEDHHVVRHALRSLLEGEQGIHIVGEVADGSELLAQVDEQRPDLLLMDLAMPNHRPVVVTEELRRRYPQLKILILSAHSSSHNLVPLFESGLDGYVLKDDPPQALVRAIRQVMAGRSWLSPQVATLLAAGLRHSRPGARPELTDRQQQVLSLMALGYRNEQIADELVLSEHTIRNHIAHIFEKLGVETRVEAVVYSLALGLISLESIKEKMNEEWPGI